MDKTLLIHYGPGPTSITQKVVRVIKSKYKDSNNLIELDLTLDLPDLFTKESMGAYVKRNYKGEELAQEEQTHLSKADEFANQLLESTNLIMVFPMYNFTVPATIKAWIDNVCQAKKLFKYTEYGPVGLSKIQKATVIPITGTVAKNASNDFLTPYITYILKFIGVQQIEINGIYGSKFFLDDIDLKIEEVTSLI